jgi:hypothetical protein
MNRLIWQVPLIALSGVLCIYLLWREGFSMEMQVREEGRVETGRLEALWYTADNRLVGVRRSGAIIGLELWETSTGNLERYQLPALRDGEAEGDPIYAFSQDANWIAWVDRKNLLLKELTRKLGRRRYEFELPKPAGIRKLAVLGGARVWVGYENGEYVVVDLEANSVALEGAIRPTGARTYAVGGDYVAAISPVTHEAQVLNLGRRDGIDVYERKVFQTPVKRLVMSLSGGLDALDHEGRLIPSGAGETVASPGSIGAIAVLEKGRWLVAGDFRGIYELRTGEKPLYLAPADPREVRLLAGNEVQLALHSAEETILFGRHLVTIYRKQITWIPMSWILLVLGALLGDRLARKSWHAFLRLLKRLKIFREEEETHLLPDPPEPLLEAILSGNCYLFAGSGLGAQAGLPVWREFLKTAVEWCVDNRVLKPRQGIALSGQLLDGPLEGVAEIIAEAIDSRCGEFRRLMDRNHRLNRAELSRSHLALGRTPFTGAITSNPDDGLELMFADRRGPVFTVEDSAALKRAVHRKEFFILKNYGTLSRPETVKIGVTEYGRALQCNYDFHDAMNEAFNKRTILFVGVSLEGLAMDLRNIVFERSAPEQHYALVPVKGKDWKKAALGLEERWGIKVLPYDVSGPGHPEFERFACALAETANLRATAATT